MLVTKKCLFSGLLLVGTLLMAAASGCGGSTQAAVQPDVARRTLDEVLTGWKNGEKPEAWRTKDPEVVVQDMDWLAGAKLVSYEIQGSGEPRDANLYCKVKLELQQASQPPVTKTVTYVVGTDPVLTVFRALE